MRSARQETTDHRGARRQPVIAPMAIQVSDGISYGVDLIDISLQGCRFASASDFLQGSPIAVIFGGRKPILAKVVWSDKNETGCQFNGPLSQDILDVILR